MLEASGHRFVRYADDCNVYVRSKRAGERVMGRMARLYAKRKLKVNEEKSTVARVWERKFLGYSFWVAPGKLVKRRVAPKALEDFKHRIRQITSRNGGRSLGEVVEELRSYLLGWKAYFRLADTRGIFHDLDQWIARRLRMVQLKQWKRGTTIVRELQKRAVPMRVARAAAAHAKRWWRIAGHGAMNTAMPTKYLAGLGLPKLAPH
jgi:RNA-directed DNA polymerase